MVRETRHLWVGNLPDNIREDRIREHFKRYGRVQSVKLLPRSTKEDPGENTMACTVAFMDIKSASKARDAEHKIDDRTLTTEYYEPVAIPSAASPQNAPSYSTSPGSTRFPNGHGPAEEHSNFSDRFYDRAVGGGGVGGRVPDPEYRAIRSSTGGGTGGGYHENNNRGRNRDRSYRTNGPYNNIIDRPSSHRLNTATWSTTTYDTNTTPSSTAGNTTSAGATTRYNNQNSDTGYSTTPSEPNERRNDTTVKKKTKSRSGSRSPSPSGSNSSRSVSRSRSRSSSTSSSSATSRDTSATSSPRSRKDRNHQEDRRPLAICVKNLPCRSSDTSLKDGLFHEYKKHGKVTSVKVVGQSSERHAIVCFKKPEDVEKALEVSYDKLFFGSKIEVAPYQGHEVDDTDSRLFEADIDEFNPKATRTLFIGNLEKDVTASDLRKHFDQFGEIIEIDIKKQGAVSSYAFCQYSDIMSVVKAIRALDGEHLGNNRIKLGFGKSMPTSCVWIDGITETVSEKYLINQFETFGAIQQVVVDREKGQGLVFFEQVVQAQAAVNKMRGVTLGRSRKLQIDFASRECQDAFYDHLEKQGHVTDRVTFEERIPRENATNTSRFSRYDTPTRPRTASYSSRSNATSNQINSTAVPSPSATPGSVAPRGSRSSRVPRHPADYYDQTNFRSYDEYSQGSGASHDEPYEHDYPYHESPTSHTEPIDRLVGTVVNDHPVTFPAPDIRNLQKERVHILEQLDDCSSGDEVISPKKKIKLDHLDNALNCDVIIEANRDHRKVMEVRRLSDASAKHHSRRPSIDSSKHRELTGHDRNPYLPHAICKRRKTAGSDNGSSRATTQHHQYDQSGSESVGGSRPGTPLCDEKPEHVPSEPRRTPRDREGPLTLPLPRFAAQVLHKGSISVAGIKGQKDNVLSSPPAAVTSPRIANPKPPSPVHVPPPASPPPRPPSLSSSSSDSDGAPPSPSLDERIRSLDEKYEKWSGSRALSAAGGDALAKLDANRDKFKIRHKLLDLNVLTLKDLQPSEIVKSVMAKRSVFDEDSKRLENVGEKYEPKEFNLFPKVGNIPQQQQQQLQAQSVPASPLAPSALLKISTTQLPKTPVVLSPRSTSTGITPAKGLQYPFPSHPPVQQTTAATSAAASVPPLQIPTTPPMPTAPSTPTCPTPGTPTATTAAVRVGANNSENRLKLCNAPVAVSSSSDDNRTPTSNKVISVSSVNRTPTNNVLLTQQKTTCTTNTTGNSSDTKPSIPTSSHDEKSSKSKSRRNSVVGENATKTRSNSECGRLENCDSADNNTENKDTEEKEREELRIQKEREERLEKERLQKEREERIQKEREERLQKEREERLQKEREERLQKEREERLQKEREERLQKEKEERLQKEREERLQKEREERLQKEREERLQKEREERLQKEREERLKKEREERLEKERLQKEREERLEKERLQKEREERLQKEREERERLQKEREERLEKERLQKEREEQLQKEREERERRERDEKERKDKEERERREREEQERLEREKLEREETERLQKEKERERVEKERRREKEDRHNKEDNQDKHRHRENHSDNNKEIRKEHDSRNHDSREQKSKHHTDRDSERRKENTKENRENNSYEKSKNNNEIKDRPSLETRHLSIDLDKNRQTDSKGDPSRRKERNNSVPAHVGSKRRMSGHEEEIDLKRIKLEHKKIGERRNSKDSNREDKNKKYVKMKSHEHKHNNDKRKDKDRDRKSDKIKSKSKDKEKSRDKESPSTTPTTPGKDMALEKDFLSRLELSESEKHKKEKKDREKRKLVDDDDRKSEDQRKEKSIERKREEMKQLKKERIRKMTNSSENSDSDEPKKHSIFDIVDDEPACISMYDKVKARSCKNMQKQEEEKRQEKIKAKFSQLKQSRAKREEKKRSTSWDEDSDSDHETKEIKRKSKMLIQSSDEDGENSSSKIHRKKEYSDSDSERNHYASKNFDTSDDDHIKHLQRKGSKSRITSDTSDDDFKHLPIKNEIFTDNEDQAYDFNESLFKSIKEEPEFTKKDKKISSKLQDDINVQIFGEVSSADESMEQKEKLEIRKKHKKKQKKKSSISDDSVKDEPNQNDASEKLKKKQHSKKEKKRDKSKDELRDKSKKSKKIKENKRDGKMENIFGSLSDDSENGSKDQNDHKSSFMMMNEDVASYLSDSDGGAHVIPPPDLKTNEEKERILKEEHRKRKEKKRREKERQRRREEVNDNSVDFSDLGKQLEANIKDDSNEIPEIKSEEIKTEPTENFTKFAETPEELEYKKEERKDKEKKKKRKKSKDEKNRHHHHHHHHEKNKIKEQQQSAILDEDTLPLPNLEVKIEETTPNLPNILDIPSPPLTKSSPSLDTPISPTELVKTPTKEKKKFIPGFGVEIDEAIHENAVKSISEFEQPKEVIIEKEEIKEEKVEGNEEKARVVISQEETEDAVAALLGESFGSAQFEDYSEQPISPINPPTIPEDVQDDEEMRQAVQSLNSTELDIKPETPQSENDLQIDTDTEDQEDISLRFDQPPKTPDAADLAQPPKTPDIPNYYKNESKSVVIKTNIGSPPSLTPIKPPQIEAVKKSLELPTYDKKPVLPPVVVVPEKVPIVEEKPKIEPKVEVAKTPPVSLASMPLLKTENVTDISKSESSKMVDQKPIIATPNTSTHNVPSHIPPFVSQKQDFVLSPKNMNRLPIMTGIVTKPLQPATLVLPQPKIAQTMEPVKFNDKPRVYPTPSPTPVPARHHLGFIPTPQPSRSPTPLYTSYQLSMQGTIEKPKVESSGVPQYRMQQSQPLQIEASVNISLTDLSVSSPSRQILTPKYDQSPSIIVSSQGKSNISISNISVNEVPTKPYMPVIQETPKVSMPEVRSPTIIQQAPPKISVNVDIPKIEVKEPVSMLKVDEVRTSTPSPVIVMNKEVKTEAVIKEEILAVPVAPVVPVVPVTPMTPVTPVTPVAPIQSAIEKVTEELNLSLEKENLIQKVDVKEEPEEEKEVCKEIAKIEDDKPLVVKTEDVVEKEEVKEIDSISVIKEIEKIDEEKADTDSVVSDISKERLSAEILSKDDPLDSKEDSDYWSAKEVNIDSVIKKVDALCSADELSDRSSEIGKEDWFDDTKTPPKIEEEKQQEPEDKTEPLEKVSRRGGRGRGGRKTRGADRGGVQTRRGKTVTKEPPTTPARRGNRGGRGGRGERKIAKAETNADIYEFRDDSDDAKDRSRFILTIHKPTFSANGNVQQQPTAIVREVLKSPVKPPQTEEFASPVSNTRKSKRLQEKDVFKSNVDDTIEDVIKNTPVTTRGTAAQTRRSQRQTVVKAAPDTPRKSPRARKNDRRASETTDDSSEEKKKEKLEVLESPKETKIENGEPVKPKEKPHEGLKATVLRRIKGEMTQELMSLIDPVTGLLTPMRECEEGKYIPVASQQNQKNPATPAVQQQQPSVVVKTKPQSLKAHVLSFQNAKPANPVVTQPVQPQKPIVTTLPTFVPRSSPLPINQNLNVNVSIPSYVPPHLSPRPSSKPVPSQLSPIIAKQPQPPSKTIILNPIIQPPVNTQIAHAQPTVVKQPIIKPPLIQQQQPPVKTPMQQVQSKPPMQQVQAKPPMQQVQVKPPMQQVQAKPPMQQVQAKPPMQQVQAKPPIQQPQVKPMIQQQPQVKPIIQQQPTLGMSNKNMVVKVHGIPQNLVQGFPTNRVVVPAKDVKDLGPAVKPNNVPQQRHVLPTGMPVPAYDASLGEGMAAHFPPSSIQMRSHDLPPHYMHPPHMMYQQLMRQQFIARSPMVPMEKRDGDGQEGEEAPVTSPPLELRRPGSVGLVLNRTGTVPHSLQSPKERTTDSPQVYGMHTARMQHYHPVNRIYDHEPPPAHRGVASTLPPITNEQRPYGLGGAPVGIVRPDRPLSNDRFTPLGQPDRPLSTHSMTMDRPMPYNLPPERNLNQAVNQSMPPSMINPNQIPKDIVGPLTTAIVGGISVCVADALARQLDQSGGPPVGNNRTGQVSTPPQMQPAVPSKGNLYQLLQVTLQMQHFPIMWQGLLALKNDQAAVQMYYVSGNDEVAKMSLPKNIDGSTPPLRIFQRMRLEPPQVEGVTRKMQAEKEHCMLIALPCGKDHDDAMEQHTNLSNGLINYLTQKQAAGIINIAAPGTTQPPAYVVHIFPSCDFVNDNLRREAPELLRSLGDLAHLLIIITTV